MCKKQEDRVTTMIELRRAKENEAEACYQCIEDARAYHRSLGFEQWHPDYPTLQTIIDDIADGTGFVFADERGIIGYCCIITGDERRTMSSTERGKQTALTRWYTVWLLAAVREAEVCRGKR